MLSTEFGELHYQHLELPLAERFGSSMLVAVRPWIPESFRRLQRRAVEPLPARKGRQ